MKIPAAICLEILTTIPATTIDIDRVAKGHTWIDIECRNRTLTVECQTARFGLYFSKDSSYGSGPDELYKDSESLIRRISDLLLEESSLDTSK